MPDLFLTYYQFEYHHQKTTLQHAYKCNAEPPSLPAICNTPPTRRQYPHFMELPPFVTQTMKQLYVQARLNPSIHPLLHHPHNHFATMVLCAIPKLKKTIRRSKTAFKYLDATINIKFQFRFHQKLRCATSRQRIGDTSIK